MKPRPILPPTETGMALPLPVRVELAPGEHITWYADGWIRKVFPNGNVEEWSPLMAVSYPYMHQTVMPSGTLHTSYHTTDDEPTVTVGKFIQYHMVEVNDVEMLHWDNDCNCFVEEERDDEDEEDSYESDEEDDANNARIYSSRCEAIGRHVHDGDCPVCAPEIDEIDKEYGKYQPEEEDMYS